jgi:hypothetical protein
LFADPIRLSHSLMQSLSAPINIKKMSRERNTHNG